MTPTVVTLLMVLLVLLVFRGTRRSAAPLNPVFVTLAYLVLAMQAVLLAASYLWFNVADVEVVITSKEVPAGKYLTSDYLTTKRVNRSDAIDAVRTVKKATGLVTQEAIPRDGQVTSNNAEKLRALALPETALRTRSHLDPPLGWVEVLAASREPKDDPVIIDGALLERRAGGGLVLRVTAEDRKALLAVLARSTISIEPSEG